MHENNVIVHCAAGKGRTSIFPLAYIIAEEDLFEAEEVDTNRFVKIFFDVVEKRPALAPTTNQLQQIYVFGLAWDAIKTNLQFPEKFFKLPEACCQQRPVKPKIYFNPSSLPDHQTMFGKSNLSIKPKANLNIKKETLAADKNKKILFIPTRISGFK